MSDANQHVALFSMSPERQTIRLCGSAPSRKRSSVSLERQTIQLCGSAPSRKRSSE